MLSMLINCGVFDENKLCWINTDNENFIQIYEQLLNY